MLLLRNKRALSTIIGSYLQRGFGYDSRVNPSELSQRFEAGLQAFGFHGAP
jgi:hypothetical protein